jgi:hypothetical protein
MSDEETVILPWEFENRYIQSVGRAEAEDIVQA